MDDRAKQRRSAGNKKPASPFSTALVCLLLSGLILTVFAQSVGYEFVNYDDQEYVYENPAIVGGISPGRIQWAFTHVHAGNWHPLTTLSHMADCTIYGLKSPGHHVTNVLLHLLATLLLFLALRRLTGVIWPCAIVAALFGIHPLRVESVAWISERKDVLSGVFFMLTLWTYSTYVRAGKPGRSRYVGALAFFALGLMCKPTLVTLPFVLLLLDYWPLQRFRVSSRKSIGFVIAEKIPFFVLSAASCAATLIAQGRAVIGLHQLSFGDRLVNAVVSYGTYVRQMFWPVDLAVVYPYPLGGWSTLAIVAALTFVIVVSVFAFVWRNRFPFLLIGWLWFLGMLIPMIGIVQVGMQSHADRYTYLSQIGLYIAAVWGAVQMASHWRRSVVWITLTTLVIGALTVTAWSQTTTWRNSTTLWHQALRHTSNNYIAKTHLADVMIQQGRLDDAITLLREALTVSDYPTAHYNLGFALASQGNWEAAIDSFHAAIRTRPNYSQAHSNLGVSLSKLGKTDDAVSEFREAVRIDPNYRDAHNNLAILLIQLGRRDEALVEFREALRLKPDDAAVKNYLRELGAEE